MVRMRRQSNDTISPSIAASMQAIKNALPKMGQIKNKLIKSTEKMGQSFHETFSSSIDGLDATVISINKFLDRKINQ